MKKFGAFLSLLLISALVYYSFYSLMPQHGTSASIPATEFSTERALVPLKQISQKPHYFGSKEHEDVRGFLVSELKKLGLETETQKGFVLNNESRSLDRPHNIVARIKGTGNGKSLLLLSHYDSALVPSFGASDAGSGLVTILESLRAYKATGKKPKNDIIVLFTDAEEIGLDGAYLFVTQHPWAKNVGLALNFEARGSGGPSNMILETNGGNANLVQAFMDANPQFPVTSSLMYSVYKLLPNDTDSTVLREEGDIDGFFFAFIDDHFDYHTANDIVENLDKNTLQHQGSYLLPLLHYFANADLSNLKSEKERVFVNFPFIKMFSYPFSWILPMLIIATILFLVLLFYGFSHRRLKGKIVARGFGIFLLTLIAAGVIGFFGWKILLQIYPQYNEIQHGFKYNGHDYIVFFVFLTLAILFAAYKKYIKKEEVASVLVAPLTLWIIVNFLVYWKLKGAAFFIIPVFFGLISLWLLMRQQRPNLLVLALLAAPAIFIFAPLIQFFPVGVGSSMVFISSVFTVLLFGLLLPVFGFYRWKNILAGLCLLVAVIFFLMAHFTSSFSEKRQKPNSLIYFEDQNTHESYWLTYDKILDDWTKNYLGETPAEASKYVKNYSSSKYNTAYTFAAPAPFKNIDGFEIVVNKDSIVNAERFVSFTIIPKRETNQIELYLPKKTQLNELIFNGKKAEFGKRSSNLLLRYYVSNNDSLVVSYSFPNETAVNFTVQQASFDLMENPQFKINKRAKNMMPKPFVVTDAIIIKKSFMVDTIAKTAKDTIFGASENILINE